ncbi:UNVERIFIED_CONTAM: Carboxypeptidase A4, partial [Siphonaria sp. JEL0065]
MRPSTFLSLLASALSVLAVDSRYRGDKLVQFQVTTQAQVDLLKTANQWGYDTWTHSGTHLGTVDVRVPSKVVDTLSTIGIPYKVLVDDLQTIVDAEREHMDKNSEPLHRAVVSGNVSDLSAATIFSDWQSYATLSAYIASLPGVTQLPSAGKTYQGQDVNAYKFGSGPYGVVYHGGIHAREWISPATVAYVTGQLVNNANLLSKFTFYVLPVANPDGYAYTRSASGDRYHRKNMQPNSGSSCIGTDPNRNFNFHWSGPGASNDPCNDSYYGPSGFSTPEAQLIANFVKNTPNVVGYIDFHSFSELFMFANGYTCSGKVKDYTTLLKGSQLAVAAIKGVHGESFANGDICNTIYQASGSSVDYTYNVLGVTYSYAVELRPNQNTNSNSGFNPPVSEIIPSGEETTAAMVALWTYVA